MNHIKNIDVVYQNVKPYFDEEGFKPIDRGFKKEINSIQFYFELESLAGGKRLELNYGVYNRNFNNAYSRVLNKRDLKKTIYIRGEVAFEKNIEGYILKMNLISELLLYKLWKFMKVFLFRFLKKITH